MQACVRYRVHVTMRSQYAFSHFPLTAWADMFPLLTHTYTHTQHTHTHTHTHTNSYSHTHTHSLSLSFTHTHTHTHTGSQSSQDKSLLAWANVMSALAENQMQHATRGDRQSKLFVPFRGSVLTRVLEESLGSDPLPLPPPPSRSLTSCLYHPLSSSLTPSSSACSLVFPHVLLRPVLFVGLNLECCADPRQIRSP